MDTDAQAREILAANRYMALGTADADGMPWVSPVWFASEDGETFLWLSSRARATRATSRRAPRWRS